MSSFITQVIELMLSHVVALLYNPVQWGWGQWTSYSADLILKGGEIAQHPFTDLKCNINTTVAKTGNLATFSWFSCVSHCGPRSRAVLCCDFGIVTIVEIAIHVMSSGRLVIHPHCKRNGCKIMKKTSWASHTFRYLSLWIIQIWTIWSNIFGPMPTKKTVSAKERL